MTLTNKIIIFLLIGSALSACTNQPSYDLVVRNGVIYDRSGSEPIKAYEVDEERT